VNADVQVLAAASETLVGRPATEESFAEAGRRAAEGCEPATDMRGSADYKRHLASELTIRTLRTAVQRLRQTPPPRGN
jgi:carbon-monoxide dehydrogenase medium subunit